MPHAFNPSEFVGIRIGHSDLFGTQSRWDQVREDLSHYTLAEVLEWLGRISAAVENSEDHAEETQAKIAFGLFGEDARSLLARSHRIANESGSGFSALFEPLQLISLAKAAFLFLPPTDQLRGTSPNRIGHALLRISDLIAPEIEAEPDLNVPDRGGWTPFLFASGSFYRGGTELHEIARFYALCLQSHEDLKSDPNYIDFRNLVFKATGLSPENLWLGLWVLLSQWKTIDAEGAVSGPVFIDEDRFLSTNFHFSTDEQARILELATASAKSMQESIRSEYSPDRFRPFDFVPLASKPLVRFGRRIFCSSTQLLMSKLSTGLYYTLANSVQGEERNRFSRFMGRAFEQYVGRMLKRMYAHPNSLLVDGDALRTAALRQSPRSKGNAKTADFLVVDGDLALVLEVKAGFFARNERSGVDADSLLRRLEDVYSRAGRQIENTIRLCEAGLFAEFGVRPEKITAYLPLVVTLDEATLTPYVYDLVRPLTLPGAQHKTEHLQIVGISELESIETAVTSRKLKLLALLGAKSRSGRHADTVRNFLHQLPDGKALFERNPYLRAIFKNAFEGAKRTLQLRMR